MLVAVLRGELLAGGTLDNFRTPSCYYVQYPVDGAPLIFSVLSRLALCVYISVFGTGKNFESGYPPGIRNLLADKEIIHKNQRNFLLFCAD
jgi:hypothetical protein